MPLPFPAWLKSPTCDLCKCYYIGSNVVYLYLGDNMLAFRMASPVEVIRGLADRMKRRRIEHGLTQRELASRSNVSYGSLRLFEETGKISLESLVKIAFALEAEAEFERLFRVGRRRISMMSLIVLSSSVCAGNEVQANPAD